MSEVKKFKVIGYAVERSRLGGGEYVLLSDFDAAQVELAALREELAGANRRLGACINQIEEQQQRLAAAEQRNAELRQELATLHAVKESPGENVLWDVLNATVGIITRRAYPHALESEAHNAGAKVILDRRAGLAATHLKPTESGASE